MKPKNLLPIFVLLVFIIAGCGAQPMPSPSPSPTMSPSPPILDESPPAAAPPTDTETDTTTSASMVSDNAAFERAISSDGEWIICLLKDLTFTKDLVLEGEFTNGKKDDKGNDIIQRKIALYTQDENRNIKERFTLTAPKLTIKSPNASIQHGTFKGDLYVEVDNFELVDCTVDGDVYFSTNDVKKSFKMDDKSKITGVQSVPQK
jgi:hypothetical protein